MLLNLLKKLFASKAPIKVVEPPVSPIVVPNEAVRLTIIPPPRDYAVELIKEFEGCRLQSYLCPAGVWTIGYGATGPDIAAGLTWTQEQAEERLRLDLRQRKVILGRIMLDTTLVLNANHSAALLSFLYNLGQGPLKTLISDRSIEQISNAILLYHKAGGKPVRGLKIRRAVEQEIFNLPPGNNLYNIPERRQHFYNLIKE